MIREIAARFNFSGFASSVGAEEGEDFAAVKGEADALDCVGGGFALAVAFVQALGFEDGHSSRVRCGVSIVAVIGGLGNLRSPVVKRK